MGNKCVWKFVYVSGEHVRLTGIFDIIGTLCVNFLCETGGKHTRSIPTTISRISSAIVSIAWQILHFIDAFVNGVGQQVLRQLRKIFRIQNQCRISIERIVSGHSRLIENALHNALYPIYENKYKYLETNKKKQNDRKLYYVSIANSRPKSNLRTNTRFHNHAIQLPFMSISSTTSEGVIGTVSAVMPFTAMMAVATSYTPMRFAIISIVSLTILLVIICFTAVGGNSFRSSIFIWFWIAFVYVESVLINAVVSSIAGITINNFISCSRRFINISETIGKI